MIQPIYASHYLNILGKPLHWNKTYLTFYTPRNLELITDALQIISWRTNNTFTFERVDNPKIADIVYEFNKDPLDLGANGQAALGYTDYESSNRIIHKATVTLDVRLKPLGVFYTAMHESLHAIGLNHSTEHNSIMNPPYAKYKVITDTDVNHLLSLYSKPS